MQSILSKFQNQLLETALASSEEIQGCSAEEIEVIESKFKLQLPATYKDFLRICGHRAEKFYAGTDMFYPDILELRAYAENLLKENEVDFQLPDAAFVFSMHQGYQFDYFHTEPQDDNPPVYYYLEGEKLPKKISESFSSFLLQSVEDHVRILQ
ncbi:MAG: SMI1/KNR4 family protein [Prochloron sp. SP5CPC1]|nr:SMI1/KNR4 family protein [Candidatus Paraprochloron terpiosi SP5CPC1]